MDCHDLISIIIHCCSVSLSLTLNHCVLSILCYGTRCVNFSLMVFGEHMEAADPY